MRYQVQSSVPKNSYTSTHFHTVYSLSGSLLVGQCGAEVNWRVFASSGLELTNLIGTML